MCYRVFSIIFFLYSFAAAAQRSTVSGFVSDRETGERLIGASVFNESEKCGAVANNFGFFSIPVRRDSVSIVSSYVGYKPMFLKLKIDRDTLINIDLSPSPMLEEVVISGERFGSELDLTRISSINVPIARIKSMPSFMGESDLMRALPMLPGVLGTTEGVTNIVVRGGGPDQNLILLDGIPMYNVSHVFGLFSSFNPDAVRHVELKKGGFPARYSGRLSSIVDVNTLDGNSTEHHASVNVGMISTRLMVEGPIKKDKTTFVVSARRSYLDFQKSVVLSKLGDGVADNFYFYDVNAKLSHKVDSRNRIYAGFYRGGDLASIRDTHQYTSQVDDTQVNTYYSDERSLISWANTVGSLRWNHLLRHNLFLNVTASSSKYEFDNRNDLHHRVTNETDSTVVEGYYRYRYQSAVRDISMKADFEWTPGPNHLFRFGAAYTHHRFTPGVAAAFSTSGVPVQDLYSTNYNSNEINTYVEDEIQLGDRIKLNAGINASSFLLTERTYLSPQPRVALRYDVGKSWVAGFSYSRMQQFVHLLSNAGIGLATDLWVPSTASIRPQVSDQFVLSLSRQFGRAFQVTAETYYKSMDNLIEYKDGASYLNLGQDWESKVQAGKGRSYGLELLVQKKWGRLTGWAGYTLSHSERRYNAISDGNWFPFRYDRAHDAKITLNYQFGHGIDASASWVYNTGTAITLPLERYLGIFTPGYDRPEPEFSDRPYISARNNYRMNPYHRLDLSMRFSFKTGKLHHEATLSVYNAYNRANPFYVQIFETGEGRRLREVTLFPVIPAFGYGIRF